MADVLAWMVVRGYTGPAVETVRGQSYQVAAGKTHYVAGDKPQYIVGVADEDDD